MLAASVQPAIGRLTSTTTSASCWYSVSVTDLDPLISAKVLGVSWYG
jgi:hypothetical protein